MQTFGSAASVIAAIREDAAAEVERLEALTASELASIRREAETADVAVPDRETRLTAARHRNEERLAQQEWEGRRAVIEQREAWIARVIARAKERVIPEDERRARLTALIDEARQQLGRDDCRIITPNLSGGCLAVAGEVTFDNTFEARAQRLEPQWRNALAALYRLEPVP